MSLQLLDVDKFLQREHAKSITVSRTFDSNMEPSTGGLQDPSIFGVSTKDKFNTWGVINLENVIMHPLIYDNINIVNPIFKRVLLKKKNYEVVDGMLNETLKGGTGLDWLMSKWDKINFDKYRTEKNKLYIDFLKNSNKNILFINKIPVIPIIYRDAHMGNFKMETSELDEMYQKIMEISKGGRSEFTSEWMQALKDKTGKDMLQNRVNNLFNYFISKIEGKSGFMRSALVAKRLDNVARMVANARPDIPINSAVVPWHILLNIFDIYVVAFLANDKTDTFLKRLGMGSTEKTLDEYGEIFDYIYRNSETYVKHYPGRREVWIEILTNIFNANPMIRILLKRDPGWNADSIWCFQPLINSDNSYQIWVPSWVYSPLGGDSLNTNFFIANKTTNTIFEDQNYIITGKNNKARVVKTMDSVWKRL